MMRQILGKILLKETTTITIIITKKQASAAHEKHVVFYVNPPKLLSFFFDKYNGYKKCKSQTCRKLIKTIAKGFTVLLKNYPTVVKVMHQKS